MFPIRSSPWHFARALFYLVPQTKSWTIHQSCFDKGIVDDLKEAVSEAQNLAEYASYRVQHNFPTWNDAVFKALIPDRDTFLSKLLTAIENQTSKLIWVCLGVMNKVPSALGSFQGKFDPWVFDDDRTVLFTCGDEYAGLTKIQTAQGPKFQNSVLGPHVPSRLEDIPPSGQTNAMTTRQLRTGMLLLIRIHTLQTMVRHNQY
jgi:hypothetical protein